MKKLILSIILLIMCVESFADDINRRFYLGATNKIYYVMASSSTKDKTVNFQVDLYEAGETAEVSLTKSSWASMDKSLEKVQQKYKEWSDVAKQNNICTMEKKFSIAFSDQDVYFTNNGCNCFESGVDFYASFKVDDAGNPYMILQSKAMNFDEVVSSNKSYTTGGGPNVGFISNYTGGRTSCHHHSNGVILIFSSEEEIAHFREAINSAFESKNNSKNNSSMFK